MSQATTEQHNASQSDLFWAFLRIGFLGFGGGPAMIPLFQQEVVKRHAWLNDEEFSDILAIANTLPGPIATKIPGYIGYRVAGVTGSINAVLAVILPTIIAMTLMLSMFSRYQDLAWVQGMSQGVIPVVMVMMAQLTWDFLNKSQLALGWILSLAMTVIAGILIYLLGIHPGWVVGGILATALLWPDLKKEAK